MSLLLKLFLALCLSISPVFAGSLSLLGVGGPVGAASGYQGPGDIFSTSAHSFFSCARAYNAAYANGTNVLCEVQRTSDNTKCNIVVKTTGFADLTSTNCNSNTQTLAQFCNATTCGVDKMVNQVNAGTCDVVQATQANQPVLLLNSTPSGTLPALRASGIVGTLQVSTCAAISGVPIAFTGVIIRTSGTTVAALIGQSGGSMMGFNTTGIAGVSDGVTTWLTQTAANNSWHAVNGLVNGTGTSSAANVDGVDTTGATGTPGINANSLRVARVSSLTGTVALAEVGIWTTTTTSINRNSICQNQGSATNGYNTAFGC